MVDVKVRGRVLKKATTVSLCRKFDGAFFHITAPCILRIPEGLIHVVGAANEELGDTSVWVVIEKFEVLEVAEPGLGMPSEEETPEW